MRAIDLLVVGFYLVLTLYVGLRVSSRADTSRGFVAAPKSLPFHAVMASLFGTLLGAGLTLGWSGEAYLAGASMLAASAGMALSIPVFVWIAPRFRRSGFITIPEMVGSKFGIAPRIVVSALVAIYCLLLLGLQFKAFGRLVGYVGSPLGISPTVGSLIGCGIAILYTSLAGMFGVAYTDILQFVLMVASVIVVIPLFAVHFAGGVSEVASFAADKGLSIFNPFSGQPLMSFASYGMILFLTMLVEAPNWQRIAAAKDMRALKIAFYAYIPLVFLYGYAMVWSGMSGAVLFPHLQEVYGSTEAVLPAFILQYMPPIIAGLMISALIGVLMSTIDSYLLLTSSSITYDMVKYVSPKLPETSLLKGLKYTTFALGVLGLAVSFLFEGIWDMLIFSFTLYPASLFPSLVACFFWRKATSPGVICSIVAGFVATIASYAGVVNFGVDPIWSSTAISAVVLVAVSYFTYDPAKETPLIGEVEGDSAQAGA